MLVGRGRRGAVGGRKKKTGKKGEEGGEKIKREEKGRACKCKSGARVKNPRGTRRGGITRSARLWLCESGIGAICWRPASSREREGRAGQAVNVDDRGAVGLGAKKAEGKTRQIFGRGRCDWCTLGR